MKMTSENIFAMAWDQVSHVMFKLMVEFQVWMLDSDLIDEYKEFQVESNINSDELRFKLCHAEFCFNLDIESYPDNATFFINSGQITVFTEDEESKESSSSVTMSNGSKVTKIYRKKTLSTTGSPIEIPVITDYQFCPFDDFDVKKIIKHTEIGEKDVMFRELYEASRFKKS